MLAAAPRTERGGKPSGRGGSGTGTRCEGGSAMKKEKKAAAENERMQMLAETTARGVAEVQSRIEGGLRTLSKELGDSVKAMIERFDGTSGSLTETVGTIQDDVRHWRRDLDDLDARVRRIEKKLGMPLRNRPPR